MEDGTCEQEDPAQLRQQLKEACNGIEKLRQTTPNDSRNNAHEPREVPFDPGEAVAPPDFTRYQGCHPEHQQEEGCMMDPYP